MLRLTSATLMLLASGCTIAVSNSALCDGTAAARTEHAAALAVDGGDASVVTGARLIMMLDAGCEITGPKKRASR